MTDKSIRLTKEECAQWIEDLRSGKFKQCKGRLRSKNQHGEYFCCLGVLHKTQGKPVGKSATFANTGLLDTNVLALDTQRTLAGMNDRDTAFTEIADHIEKRILPKR